MICCLVVGLFLASVPLSHAGEGFGNHTLGGGEDFNAGNLPPPGTMLLINYFAVAESTTLRDNAGREEATPSLGKLNFKSRTVADSLRLVHVTKIEALGGNFIWHIIVPGMNRHVSKGFDGVDLGAQSKTGLGDITVGAGIAWHPTKTFNCAAAIDVYAPTGAYRVGDMTNIGRNYWSIDPVFVFTYKGDKDSPLPGLEVSSKMMYWINTINTETSYTSGQEFSADYLIAQHVKNWAFGVNGYLTYQFTDDKKEGHKAQDPVTGLYTGMRGKSFSAGPIISYSWPGWRLTAKYQFDLYTRNRAEMDKFWLKITRSF